MLFVLVCSATACASQARLDALRVQNAELQRQLAALKRAPTPALDASTAKAVGDPRSTAATDWSKFPVGGMWIAWGGAAELGWADLRVRAVRACDPDTVGVQLEIRNDTDDPIYLHGLEEAATVTTDDEPLARAMSFAKACRNPERVISPGSAGKLWLTFTGDVARVQHLELDLGHTQGLSKHHLVFGLKKGLGAPELAKTGRAISERPAAPTPRIGEPVETPHYRLTVVGKKLCMPNLIHGAASFGVEVVFENFTNVALSVGEGGKLRDDEGREHGNTSVAYVGSCEPRLERRTVEPGDKVRGWLFPFMMPPTDAELTLVYGVGPAMGTGLHGYTTSSVAIGAFPKPDPQQAAPKTWSQPKAKKTSGTGYAVTVTNVQPCTDVVENGKMWIGVELLVENRGSAPLTLPFRATLQDQADYAYKTENVAFDDTSPCTPTFGYDTIQPGTQRRGWIRGFRVPTSAGSLRLEQTLSWEQRPRYSGPLVEETFILTIGQLTK